MPARAPATSPAPVATPAPVLLVRHLCFAYPLQAPLLRDFSADLTAGITLLQGDTGSGKSTLLHLLAGGAASLCATGALCSGALTLNGQALATNPAAYRRQVCWFNPCDAAWDNTTPADLMAAQRRLHPGLDSAAWQRHLAGFALGPHLDKPLYMHSTGSRRKAGLAVALAAGSALTLLDEPTAGLDAASVAYLIAALNSALNAAPHSTAGAAQRAFVLASNHDLVGLTRAGRLVLGDLLQST